MSESKKDTPNKVGRPSKLPDRYEKIMDLAKQGKTDQQISDAIGISRRTLQHWKTNDWEFLLTLKENKAQADDLVEATLFQKATGYHLKKTKKEIDDNGEEKIVEAYEEIPPDTTAMIFWLKNRRPKEWRDKIENELSISKDTLETLIAGSIPKKEQPTDE